MPKLWNETIEEHRNAVRDAITQTAAALAMEHGLTSVTMSPRQSWPVSACTRSPRPVA